MFFFYARGLTRGYVSPLHPFIMLCNVCVYFFEAHFNLPKVSAPLCACVCSPFGHTDDDDDDDEDDDDAVQQNYEPSRQVGGCVSDGAREGLFTWSTERERERE